MRKALYTLAVVSSILLSSLVSCSSEPLQRLAARPETTGELSV